MSGEPMTFIPEAECAVVRRVLDKSDASGWVCDALSESDGWSAAARKIAALMADGLKNASSIDSVDACEVGRIVVGLVFDYVKAARAEQIVEEAAHMESEDRKARLEDQIAEARA